MAGNRNNSNGSLNNVGTNGNYWSSTVSGTNARNLNFNSSNANMNDNNRANGFSVRCLKDYRWLGHSPFLVFGFLDIRRISPAFRCVASRNDPACKAWQGKPFDFLPHPSIRPSDYSGCGRKSW
jgi:hypothetical protein